MAEAIVGCGRPYGRLIYGSRQLKRVRRVCLREVEASAIPIRQGLV